MGAAMAASLAEAQAAQAAQLPLEERPPAEVQQVGGRLLRCGAVRVLGGHEPVPRQCSTRCHDKVPLSRPPTRSRLLLRNTGVWHVAAAARTGGGR